MRNWRVTVVLGYCATAGRRRTLIGAEWDRGQGRFEGV